MQDIRIKVTPSEMQRHAAEMQRQIANAERQWNSLCETVNASRYYWEGDAGDWGRKLPADMREDVLRMFNRLKEHPADILEMAGIFVRTEDKAVSLANTLPGDVIQ